MGLLCLAQLIVALVPFGIWRDRLGYSAPGRDDPAAARRLARHVERAASRLPFATRCLPRAMALSWMLRRAMMGHEVVFAVRPPHLRKDEDALHAWVETGGERILGELPGPWHETLRLGR